MQEEKEVTPETETKKPEKKESSKKKIKKGRLVAILISIVVLVLIVVQFLNASYYKIFVNVVEGENVMGINPLADNLDFGDLSRNNAMTRYVTLQSGGRMPSYIIIWKFGSISPLVKIDKNYFTLTPDQEIKVSFNVNIPPSAEVKKYSGKVIVFKLPKVF